MSPSGSALLVRGGQSEAEAAAERAYYESMYRYTDDGRRLVGLPRPAAVYSVRHSRTPPPRTKWTRRVPPSVLIGHASSLPPPLRRHVEHVEHCAPSRAHAGPPLCVGLSACARSILCRLSAVSRYSQVRLTRRVRLVRGEGHGVSD